MWLEPWTLEYKINKYLQIISVVWLQGGTAEDTISWTIYWCFWLPFFLWTWITQMLQLNFQVIKSSKCKKKKKRSRKTDKMTKIALIGDIFSRIFFSPYFCRCAISDLVWDETRKHFGENSSDFFFLAGPATFSYVSIAKDRGKPHRVKKQFPTSWQLYKCMMANVGGERGVGGR